MTFPDELAAFRDRTTDPGYAGLILLGTRQATTAALLLGTLEVEHVAFLLTDESQTLPQDVAAMLGIAGEAWLCPAGDHSTTLAVYQGLRRVLEAWPDIERSRIAVDVTGGMKPMSVGLEKAAHALGLQTIYIQSEYARHTDGRSVVVPGSQRLVVPPDPYTVFGDLEAAEARRLAAAHDYQGAERLFRTLSTRVDATDGGDVRYKLLADLCAAYVAWDAFDLPAAQRGLAALIADLETARWPVLGAQREQLHAQSASLARLSVAQDHLSDTPFVILRDDLETVLALLGSLSANALRREAQGRYDIAALLLYRCLELMSQRRLAVSGINPEAERITLMKGFGKLTSAKDALMAGDSNTLLGLLRTTNTARNKSILAHGFRLIRRDEEYLPFREVVDAVFERFFAAEQLGQDRNRWQEQFVFAVPE